MSHLLPQTPKRLATVALVVSCAVCLGACGYGAYELGAGQLSLGLGFAAGGLVGLLLGLLLYCQVLIFHKIVGYAYRAYEALLDTAELARRQEAHLRSVADSSSLSDWAKRIAYREKDYEFLRDTIQGAILRQDWEAAEHLIRDVDREFGYHDEAGRFREQLEQARQATTDERIAAAQTRIMRLCEQQKWSQAQQDAERLVALYPDDTRVAALASEIEQRRGDFKRRLLAEYDQAVRARDIDRAHRLLFALDQYLVPEEAEPLRDSARSVFRARLDQLHSQFGVAVSYEQFATAVAVGRRLVAEFPSSGYAQQISKLLPELEERTRQQKEYHARSAGGS